MYDAGDVDGWAERHNIALDARLEAKDDDGSEHWHVSASTERGRLTLDVTTDGSYQPDAFGQLFAVWVDGPPSDTEFNAANAVLGEDALGELASLLGW